MFRYPREQNYVHYGLNIQENWAMYTMVEISQRTELCKLWFRYPGELNYVNYGLDIPENWIM